MDIQYIFIGLGIFCCLAAIFNWEEDKTNGLSFFHWVEDLIVNTISKLLLTILPLWDNPTDQTVNIISRVILFILGIGFFVLAIKFKAA